MMSDVRIQIDVDKPLGELQPIWRFFGADEPNYAYMKDGKKLLGELGRIGPRVKYFRAHNLLTSGDGTPALKWGSTNAYTEDAQARPVYDWTIVDRIFDTYLDAGLKPLVEIGFMPEALTAGPKPYRHQWKGHGTELFTGWAYPPTVYDKWGELVYRWTKHCLEKYGKAEVESWYWEVWNEPNIGYWKGTLEEFLRLHDVAIDAVRRALPTARVGGCHTAGSGGQFMRGFLEHCLRGTNHATGQTGTPLDYIAFHAKGNPTFADGHVRMGIANQLRNIDEGFAIVASYPQLRDKPIIIGESDPDGCAACQGPQLGYRNGTMYSSYTAASFARKHTLADKHDVKLAGALTWAFEFEDQPWFAGFRALATNGIDLPVLNVFRMFGMMSGQRVHVSSSGEVPLDAIMADGVRGPADISALASADGDKVFILAWHYHDDDVPGPDAAVELCVAGLPSHVREMRLTQYLIDQQHSNAYTVWKQMGSPQSPTAEQYAQLEQAGKLAKATAPASATAANGLASLKVILQRQAVTLLALEP